MVCWELLVDIGRCRVGRFFRIWLSVIFLKVLFIVNIVIRNWYCLIWGDVCCVWLLLWRITGFYSIFLYRIDYLFISIVIECNLWWKILKDIILLYIISIFVLKIYELWRNSILVWYVYFKYIKEVRLVILISYEIKLNY